MHKGEQMLIVCGPSGVGKGTLIGRLLTERSQLVLSRSSTTRSPRSGEVDGIHYDFVSTEEFEERLVEGYFAEYARVFEHYYGTPHCVISEAVSDNKSIVFDIDVQGARQLKGHYPEAWCVLLAPPSLEVLESRLRGRGSEVEEVIRRRLSKAEWEMSQEGLFDFCIINDILEVAVGELVKVYDVMRLRCV